MMDKGQRPPEDAARWLERLTQLNVDRAKGVAPHKPFLLLVILDLFEEGLLENGLLRRDGSLAFRFTSYWSLAAAARSSRPDVRMPFYHLKRDGLLLPLGADGAVAEHRDGATHARVEASFLRCLADPGFRTECRKRLVHTYFKGEACADLAEHLGLETLAASHHWPAPPSKLSDRKRDARFAAQVLPLYAFTCALSGYHIITTEGITALDAAHIRSFNSGGPCVVQNGLALSKTAHWLFDKGLWSIDDSYRVMIKDAAFEEQGDPALLLRSRHGKPLHLPRKRSAYPDPQYLAWHRQKHQFSA